MQTNKLREALTKILNLTNSLDENCAVDPVEIRDIAKAALAEPVKNCEVGTAEELYERYEKFCCSHFNNEGDNCLKCPFSQPTCKFAWAQMPYVEKGGDGR